MWDPVQWRELGGMADRPGITVILSGSSDPQELLYVNEFADLLGRHAENRPLNLAGKLSFTQLAMLLERAALYVGPDTVTTHLAAAVGAPTVALFGPSNPVKWGPWPKGCDAVLRPTSFAVRSSSATSRWCRAQATVYRAAGRLRPSRRQRERVSADAGCRDSDRGRGNLFAANAGAGVESPVLKQPA